MTDTLFDKYVQEMMIWEMLLDSNRTNPYINFIKNNVKDKIVVECGTGTGFFSWLSVKYGAKKVYSCEKNETTIKNLTERFKDIDRIEVVDVDVFNDVLPQGDIYIHELFGHCALIEGLMFFLANCQKQGISNIYPNNIKLISCNVDNIIQTPVSIDNFDSSDLDIDLLNFFTANNKNIDPNNLLFNSEYNILEEKIMFEGDIFKLLNFDFPTNRKYLHTYFEAGFNDDYYSSFAKKQNHWEVSKQPTYAYTVSARFYLQDKLTNATRIVD